MSEKITFEAGMQELESLVQALEGGELSLEDSFKAYERASALKKSLNALLDEGDRRIRLLTESGETTLAELAAYADLLGAPELPGSGRQEYLESVVNSVLFG